MIQIIVKQGQKVLKKIPFTEGEYLIGREPNCEIQLASPEVSRRHAKLLYYDNKLNLKDLESSNGTYLNDQKISESFASLHDIIQISGYSLAFRKVKSNTSDRKHNHIFKFFSSTRFAIKPLYFVLAILMMGLIVAGFFLGGSNHQSSDPHLDIILQNVEAYKKTGNYQFAIQELHKALREHPNNPQLSNVLNELQKTDAVEKEILNVVALIDAKDYEGLANAEKSLRMLKDKYPDAEEVGFWLGLAGEEIAKGKIPIQSQENAEELQKVVPDGGKTASKTNKPPIKRQRSNTTPASNGNNSLKKTTTTRQPLPDRTNQQSAIAIAAAPPSDKSKTTNQEHLRETHTELKLSNKESSKNVDLTERQKEEAKELYYQAYRIMAYKSKNAYLKALAKFRKVQETAPDPNFEYYQKAGEKIALCKEKLTEY